MPFDVCYRLGLQFENISSKVVTPRHIPLPTLPNDSSLMFEVIMFSFTAMTTFLQFLHLYRSVWWLPQSYTRHSMVRKIVLILFVSILCFYFNVILFFLTQKFNFVILQVELAKIFICTSRKRLFWSPVMEPQSHPPQRVLSIDEFLASYPAAQRGLQLS